MRPPRPFQCVQFLASLVRISFCLLYHGIARSLRLLTRFSLALRSACREYKSDTFLCLLIGQLWIVLTTRRVVSFVLTVDRRSLRAAPIGRRREQNCARRLWLHTIR
jgi:hypothetical protein